MKTNVDSERSVPRSEAYPLSSISKLHVTLVDAIKGYDTMTEKAEPDLRLAIQPFATIHRRHAAELVAILKDNGLSPDNDGSLMGLVHETVVSVRALFGDLDTDALPSVISGEEAILSSYFDALADVAVAHNREPDGMHTPLAERLNAHVQELQTLLQQARARVPFDN
jgi:rubrerythrin